MKVQRYVAWASVAILSLSASNADALGFDIGSTIASAIGHVIGTPATSPMGRPGAPTSTEPPSYKELDKTLKEAPAASGLKVEDATVLKERTKPDTEKKTFNVAPSDVEKLVRWNEFYQKFRAGLTKCSDDKRDAAAAAKRALLDSWVDYLNVTLGKDEVTIAGVKQKTAQLDERVVLAYQHAFKQVFDKEKASYPDLKGELDAGAKQLLDMVGGTPQALFGRKWTDTYTEDQLTKDAEVGAKTPIVLEANISRKQSYSAPIHMFHVAKLAKEAKDAIEKHSKDATNLACRAIAPPAPPSGTPTVTGTPSPTRTGTPSGTPTKTPTPSRTGTLPPPGPDPDPSRTGTPAPTPGPTGPNPNPSPNPTPSESPVTTPPIVNPPPPGQDTFVNPFNNDLFNALGRQFDDQNRAVLDLLREAQDAARRAQLDAQRAIQDANNNQRDNGADALKAALQGRGNEDQQQQPFPFQPPQAAIPAETGSEGPQFEPIPTPPQAEGTPPAPAPPPFFFPPPQPATSSLSNVPDRPILPEEGPRPMFWGPQPDPRASAALELLRFNQQVQQQAMLAAQQRGANTGMTVGNRLMSARPPRRLTPGGVGGIGVPARYQGTGGVGPTVIRRR